MSFTFATVIARNRAGSKGIWYACATTKTEVDGLGQTQQNNAIAFRDKLPMPSKIFWDFAVLK